MLDHVFIDAIGALRDGLRMPVWNASRKRRDFKRT